MEEKVIPKPERCPECGSINLITDYDTGETVCGDCGVVLSEQMEDKGPEWRAYDEEQKAERTRVGAPEIYTIHDKGLPTDMIPLDRDAFGRKLSPQTRLQMWRLRRRQIHSRVKSSVERNLAQAMQELDRLADKLHIPLSPRSTVREDAAVIYRKALDKNLIRGRSIMAMIPACLCLACRNAGILRTFQEIADASLVDKKKVRRCYNFLLKELGFRVPRISSISCLSKISDKIGISGKTQGRAVEIIQQVKKKRRTYFSGKDPRSVAAAALYIACLENSEQKKGHFGFIGLVTQKNIADAAGLTEVTIRNRLRDLEKILGIKISK